MPTDTPVTATLVRGRYYDHAGTVWNRDEGKDTHPVTPEQEAYLREHGNVHSEIELEPGMMRPRARFAFSNDAPAPAPETRRRVETQR